MVCAVAVSAETVTPKLLPRDRMEALLNNYVLQNRAKNVCYSVQPRIESFSVDDNSRKLTLVVSPVFASQDFTEQSVKFYYKRLAKSLPKPYSRYGLSIQSAGLPIEQMVAGAKDESAAKTALWGHINYDGMPWVLNFLCLMGSSTDISRYGHRMAFITTTRRTDGSGSVLIFSARPKTCSRRL